MKQRDNHIDKTKTIGTLKFQWFDDGADDENRTRNASLGSKHKMVIFQRF